MTQAIAFDLDLMPGCSLRPSGAERFEDGFLGGEASGVALGTKLAAGIGIGPFALGEYDLDAYDGEGADHAGAVRCALEGLALSGAVHYCVALGAVSLEDLHDPVLKQALCDDCDFRCGVEHRHVFLLHPASEPENSFAQRHEKGNAYGYGHRCAHAGRGPDIRRGVSARNAGTQRGRP